MRALEGRLAAGFWLALAAELVYLAGRTWLLRRGYSAVAEELAWTAWRLPFMGLYLALYRDFRFGGDERRGVPRNPLLLIAIALSLVGIPVDPRPADIAYRITLVATTPIIGIREELFYRAILQGGLERVLGPLPAILIATCAFTAFHVGAQSFTIWGFAEIAALGAVFGVIYQRTRNVWLVAALHALVDALWPVVPQMPVAPWISIVASALAVLAALAWWRLDFAAHR